MSIAIDKHERHHMEECFDRFRIAAHALVRGSLERHSPEHETRPLLHELQRGVEKELAGILGSERAATFCSELVAHPSVLGCIAEHEAKEKKE